MLLFLCVLNVVIVFVVSCGKGLEVVIEDKLKVMLLVVGKLFLCWFVDGFKMYGVNDIIVVGGYCVDVIDMLGIKFVVNECYV